MTYRALVILALACAAVGSARLVSTTTPALTESRQHAPPHLREETRRAVFLLVDLEGDGLRLTDDYYPVRFDVDGDGRLDHVHWTVAGHLDAFLLLDAGGEERSLSQRLLGRRRGWLELRELDGARRGGNHDGRLSREDRAWRALRTWVDLDQDGRALGEEISRLEDRGLRSLSLGFREGLRVDGALNLQTAWAPAELASTARSRSSRAGGAWVYEVHLPWWKVSDDAPARRAHSRRKRRIQP